jgi:4-carboxymuconolactone decarboxylase
VVPYVGVAEVYDFLHATNEVLTERGIQLPLPGQATTIASEDQMHIQRYLSANCLGDHVSREGIDIPTRELLILSMLVSVGGCDAQVKGHVSANLHVGNDRGRLIDVIKGRRIHLLPTELGSPPC